MGYTVLLDIIGALVIGGILLLSIKQINNNTVINLGYYNQDYIMQYSMLQTILLIERDFKRIGYTTDLSQITSTTQAITQASDTCITIRGDFDNNGTVETLKYYIGNVNELANSRNPKDRILYRQVDAGTPLKINYNVTYFNLDYFDYSMTEIAVPVPSASTGTIATIQISLKLESQDNYQTSTDYDKRLSRSADTVKYAEVYWRQIRVSAKNLKNR